MCRGGGALKFDGLRFTQYNHQSGLGDNDGFVAFPDPDGSVWIGKNFSGLNKFEAGKIIGFSEAEQVLMPKLPFAIYRDVKGRHWFGSPEGLYGYDGSTWVHRSSYDGLPSDIVWGIVQTGR